MTLIFARKLADGSIECASDKRTCWSDEYHDNCNKIIEIGDYVYLYCGDLSTRHAIHANPILKHTDNIEDMHKWNKKLLDYTKTISEKPDYNIIVVSKKTGRMFLVDEFCNVIEFFDYIVGGSGRKIASYMVSSERHKPEEIFTYVSSRITSVSSDYDSIIFMPKNAIQKVKKEKRAVLKGAGIHAKRSPSKKRA